ncbi:hypothetical protein BXZ70DRAFT_900106 [Cristinia sonorae]|uniref:Protein-S-isoprenylcysteine O-methyltransferase n=1 Tax=Cristinia sonorae TaxID=1940300 RepID=A0A8K0UHU5_9AGAR|nr:hypothetical protein BXZ70DRAFT_900106 [Cristinia sonorae]
MASLLFHPAVKVPLLLANLFCGSISSSSPNPPPKEEERRKYDSNEKTREYLTEYQRTMNIITIIEILLLLARFQPSLINNTILHAVLNSPAFTRLRVTPTFLLGSLLSFVATLIRIWCYRTLGRHFTFQLAILSHHKLITSGPYAIVRHPGYTASVIMNTGALLCQLSEGSFLREVVVRRGGVWGQVLAAVWVGMVGAVSWMLVSRIPKEDTVLRKEFGEEWDGWAERTRYRLIPGVY